MRILLVEDNPADALLFEECLIDEGLSSEVVVATSLEMAAGSLGQALDVVVLDLSLPDASGLDVVRALRELDASLPLVVLTGDARPELGAAAIRAGAEDFLVKEQLGSTSVGSALEHAIQRAAREEGLRAAFDDSPLAQMICSASRVVMANAAARRLGFERGQAEPWPGGAPRDFEVEVDDEPRTIAIQLVPTRWAGSAARQFLLQDVTELRQVERQLRERGKRLAELERLEALGRLSGSLAHRVNNAMATVRGHCELLGADGVDGLRPILEATEDLEALIAGLLTFAERQPDAAARTDLCEVLCARTSGLVLPSSVTLELGPCVAAAVPISRAELTQLLAHVATNAVEAGASRLRVTTRALDEQVELSFEDDGEGISAEALPKVVEPFYSTRSLGSGLGLAAVDGLCRKAGGRLELDSVRGRGTTVRVLLPSLPPSKPHEHRPEPPRRPHVLVAEDDDHVRRLLVIALSRSGFTVSEAADGESGLELFGKDPASLVVTDVDMPRLTGPEMLERIRAAHGPVPCLFVSGYTKPDLGPIVLDERTRFLTKPFQITELQRVTGELCRARGQLIKTQRR